MVAVMGESDEILVQRAGMPLARGTQKPWPVMHTEVPELVPARMLNEYAYCPRLFFFGVGRLSCGLRAAIPRKETAGTGVWMVAAEPRRCLARVS